MRTWNEQLNKLAYPACLPFYFVCFQQLFMNDLKRLVKRNTANVAVPCATGISEAYCTVAATSVRS